MMSEEGKAEIDKAREAFSRRLVRLWVASSGSTLR